MNLRNFFTLFLLSILVTACAGTGTKNISDLSKIADIERTHLYRKLKQLGIKTK